MREEGWVSFADVAETSRTIYPITCILYCEEGCWNRGAVTCEAVQVSTGSHKLEVSHRASHIIVNSCIFGLSYDIAGTIIYLLFYVSHSKGWI